MRRTFDRRDGDFGTTILIVDDEEIIRANLSTICKKIEIEGKLNLLTASDLNSALDILSKTFVNVVLLDKNLKKPDVTEDNGIDGILEMLQLRPQLQILIVSGSRESQDIVRAMKYGAFGFVTKGIDDELLPAQIQKAIQFSQLHLDKIHAEKGKNVNDVPELVGKSAAINRLKALLPQLSETESPVLLLGETGTGKTTFAKLIHQYRKQFLKQERRPFFYLNMASMSPSLIERELFGAEPGSYTGAAKVTHQGFFELANTGTLFLDEIGEISLDVQTKLLEVLQEGTFYRVGGTKKITTSFKLVCATNKNLQDLVNEKRFREDLYWRIAALPIELASLKDRKEDIPDLLKSLLPKISKQNRTQVKFEDLPEDFVEHLVKYPPSGNIRGLEQKLTQLFTLCPKDKQGERLLQFWRKIPELSHFPIPRRKADSSLSIDVLLNSPIDTSSPEFPGFSEFLGAVEKRLLLDAKHRYQTVREMEKALKLSKSTISLKLKQLRLKEAPRISTEERVH